MRCLQASLVDRMVLATEREVTPAELHRLARLASVLVQLPGWYQLDDSLVGVEAQGEGSFAAGSCNRVAVIVGPIDGRELKFEVWLWHDGQITCGRMQSGKTVFQNCAVDAGALMPHWRWLRYHEPQWDIRR